MSADAFVPAYLGWRNPEPDKESLRLYATDEGQSPRWDQRYPSGRVAEVALRERFGPNLNEGDRYLVIRVGDRFVSDELLAAVADAARTVIAKAEEDGESRPAAS